MQGQMWGACIQRLVREALLLTSPQEHSASQGPLQGRKGSLIDRAAAASGHLTLQWQDSNVLMLEEEHARDENIQSHGCRS